MWSSSLFSITRQFSKASIRNILANDSWEGLYFRIITYSLLILRLITKAWYSVQQYETYSTAVNLFVNKVDLSNDIPNKIDKIAHLLNNMASAVIRRKNCPDFKLTLTAYQWPYMFNLIWKLQRLSAAATSQLHVYTQKQWQQSECWQHH